MLISETTPFSRYNYPSIYQCESFLNLFKIFQGESTLRETVCRTLNNLLAVLVSSFDTERLASQADLRSATCSVLRGSSRAAENFWTPDQGLNFVWSETVSQFPLEMVALLELSKAAAHYSNENKIKV